MPLYSRPDFSKVIGMSTSNLSNYIKAKKVLLSGEFINTDLPQNKYWIEQRYQTLRRKKKQVTDDLIALAATSDPMEHIEEDQEGRPRRGTKTEAAPTSDWTLLEIEKKQVDIERQKTQIDLNRLKIQKQEGELIPTELMKPIISQLAMSFVASFKQASENLITEIGHKKKMKADDIADIRSRLGFIINTASTNGVEDAKKQVSAIAEEVSEEAPIGRPTGT